jgi:hypothetical protein
VKRSAAHSECNAKHTGRYQRKFLSKGILQNIGSSGKVYPTRAILQLPYCGSGTGHAPATRKMFCN